MTVIVTGGAGYIGSHVVQQLRIRNEQVVIVDDLSSGLTSRVPGQDVHKIDLSRDSSIGEFHDLVVQTSADSIIHFAAKKSAPESVTRPQHYFRKNVGSLLNVIAAIQDSSVSRFVFSSSAAVYGDAKGQVTEDAPTHPLNPYGDSKLMGEQILNRESSLGEIKVANLRYFNVAGAGSPALADTSVSNLIPMVLGKITNGRPPQIFGDDYETPDGSCIRDYIHVVDLATAHIAALDYLDQTSQSSSVFNIGTGSGYSVKQVIDVVKVVTGFEGDAEILPRRAGDPAQIVADVSRAKQELGWTSQLTLEDMVRSAWEAAN